MPPITLKLKYGSKQSLLNQPTQAGSMMLSKDTQQIFFDFPNNGEILRRSFAGIVYLNTQEQREALINPQQQLYFVRSTYKFYYYFSNIWYSLFESSIVITTFNDMQQMTECNENKLYLDTTASALYHGINISGTVIWIKLNTTDVLSDYVGQLNIRKLQNGVQKTLIATQSDSANLIIGSENTLVKINGNIQYQENAINTAGGLVQLDENGKIPQELYDTLTYDQAYFETKTFAVNNLVNYRVSFTFEQLGIEQPTIIQLLDDAGLVRDDIIPIYWTNTGITINLQPIQLSLTQNTGNFTLKYLIAREYDGVYSGVSQIATKSFDPYGLPNNLKVYSMAQLGIQHPTMVQLIDYEGLIRDDIIPVYWQNNNLYINFAPISQVLTQSGHIWSIKYLVGSTSQPITVATTAIVKKYFDPYGLTNHIKSYTFEQLGLTTATMVQLFDDQNILRDDIIPIYWTENGLQINFEQIDELFTETGHVWHIKYLKQGTRIVAADRTAQAAVLTKYFDPYGVTNNIKVFTLAQLNLTKPTIVQLIDYNGVIRDDIIPIYWDENNLYINLQAVQEQITEAGHMWHIEYLSPGTNEQLECGLYLTKAYADNTYATKEQVNKLVGDIDALLSYILNGSDASNYSENSY